MKKVILLSTMFACSIVLLGCTDPANPTADGTTPTVPNNAVEAQPTDEAPTADREEPAEAAIDTASLATCLTDAGMKMYGTEWCSHCKNQKNLFGEDFASIDYTDCDADKPTCVAAGVQGFPTWGDAEGNLYPGTQTLERLASLAGC